MESGLITSKFAEFHTNGLLINLEYSDADFGLLLLVALVLGLKSELGLVLLIIDDWLDILLLTKMLAKSLFDHVWIIGGEELGFVGEKVLVRFESFLWLH